MYASIAEISAGTSFLFTNNCITEKLLSPPEWLFSPFCPVYDSTVKISPLTHPTIKKVLASMEREGARAPLYLQHIVLPRKVKNRYCVVEIYIKSFSPCVRKSFYINTTRRSLLSAGNMVQPRRKRGANGTSQPLGRNAEKFLTPSQRA